MMVEAWSVQSLVGEASRQSSGGILSSCLEEVELFVLLKSSIVRIRLTHFMAGKLVYSNSTYIHVNFIHKQHHRGT